MKRTLYFFAILVGIIAPWGWAAESSMTPLSRAHAHNDYEHERPLLDALGHGFCSVEADVYLVEGRLLVAHDRDKVSPSRTLQSLYLDPLRERATRNGGRVFRNGPVVTLLVDIKSEAEATYAALREAFKQYAELLCTFSSGAMETKAVLVIISGNRPRKTMEAEPLRYAAYDGRPEDLDSPVSANFIPWISESWGRLFKWRGEGPIPSDEKRELRQFVSRAHAQERKVRFWGTPDRQEIWQELHDAGADLINADDLTGLQAFLLRQGAKKPGG